ncbi:hypothetical protein [Thermus igniterrae]|uniref:hypothetical protein n=1 Tax=Thermus igniterrae TaxID=88189 RepID=UPI0003818325|nr:hypothetical protein [Thermus igniterrae]
MKGVREARLEAHVLALLREEETLDGLHARLKPLFPRLGKATLFALLVRLRREGRVVYREGRFRLAGEAQGQDV